MRVAAEKALTLRELNRAMLARQLLLERTKLGIVAAIERLPALQAQWAPSPYYALWARLAHFTRERLWAAIESHRVIRARLMRGTLHLVSARDFYAYAVATQDLQRGAWNRVQVAKGIEPDAVAELAIAFARHPRAREDVIAHLRDRLGEVFNEDYRWLLWRFVSAHADLVSAPPGGHWGYGGTEAPYVAAKHWIAHGSRPNEDAALDVLVRRAVAAFGPATLADVAKFAGAVPARIRPALDRLAPRLARFQDEQGRTLFDLKRSPRPSPDLKPPIRFLPRYEQILIAYQHRDRVIAPRHRPAIYSKNGIIEATFLVDGFVAGTWSVVRNKGDAVVAVHPFARLAPADRTAALVEAERLARFAVPEARVHGAKVA